MLLLLRKNRAVLVMDIEDRVCVQSVLRCTCEYLSAYEKNDQKIGLTLIIWNIFMYSTSTKRYFGILIGNFIILLRERVTTDVENRKL